MGETLVYGTAFMEVSVQLVPQIDRMGSARAWLCLQRAGVGELANDPTAPFKWWFWIATVAQNSPIVVRPGAVSAKVDDARPHAARVRVRQSDGAQRIVELRAGANRRPQARVHAR